MAAKYGARAEENEMMQRLITLIIGWIATGTAVAEMLDGVEGRHGVAMHGDVGYPADFTHFRYVNPEAPKGGRLHLGAQGTYDSLNSHIVKGTTPRGLGLTYNTLASAPADEAFTYYGELAELIFMPEDRSWVAFKLRGEARWHDGKQITTDDVTWTFDTLVAKGLPFFRYYYGNVAEVVKVRGDIVRFNFSEGENQELPLILGQLPVLPKHYWEGREWDATTLEPPLGSGPYRIGDFEAGRMFTLERVEDYWGEDLPVHRGFHNFDTIQYDYYRDSTVSLVAFKAGEFDYRTETSSKDWATGYDVPAVKDGTLVKKGFSHNRSSGMQGFAFNLRRAKFSDPRVRQAITYAFDFEWSNQNLFYDQYTRTRSYFDNSELAAVGLPSAAELELLEPLRKLLPPEVFTTEYNPPTGGGPKAMRANYRTAGRLLKDAGWVIRDGKRVNEKTGEELTFEVTLVQPTFERVVLPFNQNLAKLGIKATVRTVDTSQYRRRLDTYDFDVIIHTVRQSLSPGNEQRAYWGTESATNEGGRNVIGIQDPAIDVLLEKVIEAPNREQLVIATRALDRALQWGHYVIPQWHISYDRTVYWDKFGYPPVTSTQGNQLMTWWVDPARAGKMKGRLKSEP